jgi:hypothetical protein
MHFCFLPAAKFGSVSSRLDEKMRRVFLDKQVKEFFWNDVVWCWVLGVRTRHAERREVLSDYI